MLNIALVMTLTNSSFVYKDEVKIEKKCFVGLSDLKCETFRYMIISVKDGLYKIGPGKAETVYSLCIAKPIKENCIHKQIR